MLRKKKSYKNKQINRIAKLDDSLFKLSTQESKVEILILSVIETK